MKTTETVLDRIIESKRARLRSLKQKTSLEDLKAQIKTIPDDQAIDFYDGLKAAATEPKIIAEVKKVSPSGGVLNDNFSLDTINQAYQAEPRVAAISVITEQDYFQGSDDFLSFFVGHNTNHKPLLRKDFIFDPYQIYEAKVLGAHAYLLIACLLDRAELDELIEVGQSIGLEPLVEIHTPAELDLATSSKVRCIGVNARDLKTFKIDTEAHNLLRSLDDSYARVAESGIKDPGYLKQIASFCDAALVGTQFMKAPDITMAIEAMI